MDYVLLIVLMRGKGLILLKKVFSHELISGSAFIFFGSMVGNILAFLFNLFLLRRLSVPDYAIFVILVALINLIAIPSQSFVPIIVKFTGSYLASGYWGKAKEFYLITLRFVLCFALILSTLFFLFSPITASFLHISNVWYLVICGILIIFNYVWVVNTAFFQGLLLFRFLGIMQMVIGVLKFGLGAIFVLLGFRVFGALGGIFSSFLIPCLISFVPLKRLYSHTHARLKIDGGEILLYAIPASVSVFALFAFTSTDLFLVKHFFEPVQAGYYAGISFVGKVIFYFTAPISQVMFPLVVKRHSKGESFHRLFYLSLLLVLIPSVALTLFYFLFPQIALLFFTGGAKYIKIAPYLGWYAVFLTVFSVLNVYVLFFLSLKKTLVTYFVGIGAIVQAFLIILFHSNFWQVIFSSLSVAVLLLSVLLVYYFTVYGRPQKIS